jgi:MoaA/NifB/PqqE/SkfB family radical SAM enzyme
MKQIIRLTESDLRRIVKESVSKILKEHEYGQMPSLGRKLTNAEMRDLFPDEDEMYRDMEKRWRSNYDVAGEDQRAVDSDGDPMR